VKNQWSSLHTYNYKQRVPGTNFRAHNTWQLVLYNRNGCKDEITSFGPENRFDDDNFKWSADGNSNDQVNSFKSSSEAEISSYRFLTTGSSFSAKMSESGA
jgi:hypothetical protein